MKRKITFFHCLLVLLAALPFTSQAQKSGGCSGRFNLTYPSGNTTTTTDFNNGSGTVNEVYCPTGPGSPQRLVFKPVETGTVALTRTVGGVVTTLSSIRTTVNGGGGTLLNEYYFDLPPASTSVLYSLTTVSDCNNPKSEVVNLTLAPSLTLASSLSSVCQGGSTTLTAAGSPSGVYTWTGSGTDPNNTTATQTVTPTAAGLNEYTVTANTSNTGTVSPNTCGTVTQRLSVFVPSLTAIAAQTVCTGRPATLTAASNVPGATLTWTNVATGDVVGTGNSVTVTPMTSAATYRVTSSDAGGCTGSVGNASTRDVNVTQAAAATLAAGSNTTSITPGQSATLSAASNISDASFGWSTGGSGGPQVGTGPMLRVSPTTTTTYTVTSTTSCGTLNQDITITVTGPLPVELTAFEAQLVGATALLTWTTSQELDNEFFAVERSTDGRRFVAVGRVAGAGTTRTRTEYRFTDALAEVRAGTTLYYRLRQVDYSGLVQYSPVRALQVGARTTALLASVQPNPLDATSSLRVVTPQAGPLSYTIHDAVGRQLAAESVMAAEGAQTLALPALAAARAGVYFLIVRQGSQQQVLRLSHR